MKDKLHVLVIPTWYPNGKDKLMGIYHKVFCKALADSGKVNTNMIYIYRQGISLAHKYPFMKKYTVDNCDGYDVYIKKMLDITKFGFDRQMKAYTRTLEKLFLRYVKKFGYPDVIHAQTILAAGYAASVIGKKYSIPVVVTEHATYFESFFTGKKEKYARFVAENASINCVGKYMCSILKEKYSVTSEVLPNIADTATFGIPKAEPDETFRLITIAGLRPPKKVDNTVKALKLLRDRGEIGDFEFVVVGDGEMEESYKKTTSDLSMDDKVKFVGRKASEEVSQYLSKADALVIASEIETFGIPAVEALASGTPVICTKCKGPEGFLDGECAELCEVNDVEDLARAIKNMYLRKGSFDPDALRIKAKEFSSESVANKAIGIYKRILAK